MANPQIEPMPEKIGFVEDPKMVNKEISKCRPV
jgi:hypothetical protein